jgi:hypothetical protein
MLVVGGFEQVDSVLADVVAGDGEGDSAVAEELVPESVPDEPQA